MHTLLEVAQALLITVGMVAIALCIFLWIDRVSSRRRMKNTERALAKQILVEKMKKASGMNLADAVRTLSDVGIFSEVKSGGHRIVVPEFFWDAGAENISRVLISVVKGANLGDDTIYCWGFALQDLLIEEASSDPYLAVKITACIAVLDNEIGCLLAP